MADSKRRTMKELPPLSRLEQRIMGIVWNLGECSSAEVIVAHKGYIELVPTVERQHRLKPAVSREKVGRRTLRELVSGFFGGSPQQIFSYLIKEEQLSEDDLEELRRLIEERQQKGK